MPRPVFSSTLGSTAPADPGRVVAAPATAARFKKFRLPTLGLDTDDVVMALSSLDPLRSQDHVTVQPPTKASLERALAGWTAKEGS